MIDISKYKVVYREKVLNAVALLGFEVENCDATESKLGTVTVLAIGTDGTLITIRDQSFRFQFLLNIF